MSPISLRICKLDLTDTLSFVSHEASRSGSTPHLGCDDSPKWGYPSTSSSGPTYACGLRKAAVKLQCFVQDKLHSKRSSMKSFV